MAKFGVLNMTGESDEIIRANLIKAGMIDEDTELHILSRADLGLSEEASTEEMIEMVEAIMEAAEETGTELVGAMHSSTDDTVHEFDLNDLVHAGVPDPGEGIHNLLVPVGMSEDDAREWLRSRYPGYTIELISSSDPMDMDDALELAKNAGGETLVIGDAEDFTSRLTETQCLMANATISVIEFAETLRGEDHSAIKGKVYTAAELLANGSINFKEFTTRLMHATDEIMPGALDSLRQNASDELRPIYDEVVASRDAEASETEAPFPVKRGGTTRTYDLVSDSMNNLTNTLDWFGFERIDAEELSDEVDVFIRPYGNDVYSCVEVDEQIHVNAFTIRPDLNEVYARGAIGHRGPGILESATQAIRDQHTLINLLRPVGGMGGETIEVTA